MKNFQNQGEMSNKELRVVASEEKEAVLEALKVSNEELPVVAMLIPETRELFIVDRRMLIPQQAVVPVPLELETKEDIIKWSEGLIKAVMRHEPCIVCGQLRRLEGSGKRITEQESDLVPPEAVGKWVCSLQCFKELVHLHFLIDHGRRLNRMEQAQIVMGAIINHKKPN